MASTAGVNYTYDGDGKRVEKSGSTLYWYGMDSDTLEETNTSGALTNDYIFFGGQRIARRDVTFTPKTAHGRIRFRHSRTALSRQTYPEKF